MFMGRGISWKYLEYRLYKITEESMTAGLILSIKYAKSVITML